MIKPFDPSQLKTKRPTWRSTITLSLIAIAVLLALMKALTTFQYTSEGDLYVYCADGLLEPMKEAAAAFEKEFGLDMQFEFGSSVHLQVKMDLDEKEGNRQADLYLADDVFTANQVRDDGRTLESIPLASFRLVIASKPSANLEINSLDDIIDKRIPFAMRDPRAGVGQTTKQALENLDAWRNFNRAKKASYATDKETADAVQNNDAIQAGFVWSTTAKEYGLKIHDLPSLAEVRTEVTVNVLSSTKKAALALQFARYLAAAEKGQRFFDKHHFNLLPGDPWAEKPDLSLFCGAVHREAIGATITAFEQREGCRVSVEYAGSGSLVNRIQAIQVDESNESMPDVFISSDMDHMNKVSKLFVDTREISATEIVLLSRQGNPKTAGTLTLDHLSKTNLRIGTVDPNKSALGKLSWVLLQGWGVAEVIKNKESFRVWPTTKQLVDEMAQGSNLDVVMVYEVDCAKLPKEDFKVDFIDDEVAKATQIMASAKETLRPQLASRFIEALNSAHSRDRYLKAGFQWKADDDR